ncbi:YggS family pyridoxal phosphate-dependent enzyme [Metabacillus litoralis]|jgi:pyridoxal phosphate enzyme (YggS family)|uniref:YggS family pyridoxal phosphate-dependent enzyme n=1 Tax=Metabacillus litoralis TaxID=152268 RepID=UPI002041D23F|nr:YggS family pyridoxal phosphate-dependent enzyme [Metabacillus litoralis]MCM3652731.1 YggS family pyridoxal phosphate-dependent enzyme [Metabacillus litoralis]
MNVQGNYQEIRKKITAICERTGRHTEDVKVIAVTKYVSIERAKEAIDAGVQHLGENRDEGINSKYQEIGEKAVWHFIGSLQTRKVKNIIDKVEYIHSLDRFSLAQEINKRASRPIKCFLQVNVSGEESKHGCSPDDVEGLVTEMESLSNIEIVGLMTMAPFTDDKEHIRTCFKQLKVLQQKVQALQLSKAPCQELSMGMSNDYEIAIEEGATFIRIGTSLVGNENGGV